jgi:hypothetical protein
VNIDERDSETMMYYSETKAKGKSEKYRWSDRNEIWYFSYIIAVLHGLEGLRLCEEKVTL